MKSHYLLFFIWFLAINISAQTAVNIAQTDDAKSLRLQTFEKVWSTVNDKHFDPTFGGVDWKKVKEIYEPQAISAKTDAEFYSVLQRMLEELKQSHFNVMPPNTEIASDDLGDGEIGVDLQIINNQAVISKIETNSDAAAKGLKTGFIINKINDKTVSEILTKIDSLLKDRKESDAVKAMYRKRALLHSLSGKSGNTLKLEILNAKNLPQTFEILLTSYKGEMSLAFGNFPAQRISFESKVFEKENIGYVYFNIWVIAQMPKLREAIKSMQNTKGLIIDLRGNPGGMGGMASGLAGLMVNEKTSLGTMKSRTEETNFFVSPQPNPYSGKIVILTDGESASTSEVFAAGMQEIGRAKVIGQTTAGAVLPSFFEKLPTGAIFQYAISDYKSPNKVLIEGRGVKPDKDVKITRQSLLSGRDIFIDTAIKEILQGK